MTYQPPYQRPANLGSTPPTNGLPTAANSHTNGLATHPPYPPGSKRPFGRAADPSGSPVGRWPKPLPSKFDRTAHGACAPVYGAARLVFRTSPRGWSDTKTRLCGHRPASAEKLNCSNARARARVRARAVGGPGQNPGAFQRRPARTFGFIANAGFHRPALRGGRSQTAGNGIGKPARKLHSHRDVFRTKKLGPPRRGDLHPRRWALMDSNHRGTSQQCCPECGRPFAEPPVNTAPEDALSAMRAACIAMSIAVSWDLHIGEADAARLLRRAPSTLRNRRALDRPLPFRKRSRRIEYALADLARWSLETVE